MFSHIFIGVSDFGRVLAFYTPLMDALGLDLRFCDTRRPWAEWQSPARRAAWRRPRSIRLRDATPAAPSSRRQAQTEA